MNGQIGKNDAKLSDFEHKEKMKFLERALEKMTPKERTEINGMADTLVREVKNSGAVIKAVPFSRDNALEVLAMIGIWMGPKGDKK